MLSLATVYKTLDALRDGGLVREVATPGETKRFDANMGKHHHMVCNVCGRISDFTDVKLDSIKPPPGSDFRPEEVSVQILGRCERCADKNKDREGTIT